MKYLVKILTVLLIIDFTCVRVFASGDDTFTDFTDVDADTLVDITSDYGQYDLLFGIERKLVIDSASSIALQEDWQVGHGNHSLSFSGSYYDNSIVSLSGCTESGFNYTQSQSGSVTVVEIDPGVYISTNHSSNGLVLNYGIDVNYQNISSSNIQSSSISSSNSACRLVGMEDGDGAIDGTTLLAAGYEKITKTYNDGTLNGHTATFYVPGDEQLNFSTDDLDDLLSDIVTTTLNDLTMDYHYQYDYYLTGSPDMNMPVPEYGLLESRVYLPLMWGYTRFLTDTSGTWLEDFYMYHDQNTNNHTYVEFNPSFRSGSTVENNQTVYNRNYSRFYWSGTDNPHWYFRSKQLRYSASLSDVNGVTTGNNIYDEGVFLYTPTQGNDLSSNYFGLSEQLYTVTSSVAENYEDLTAGYKLPVGIGFNNIKYYKVVDSGRLGLFNQLGSFLQRQFNRISDLISNIDGGGDTINDFETNYNIDIDTDLNNYVENIFDAKDDIDLTLPEYNIPSNNNIGLLSDIPLETIKLFTDNHIGYFIFLPLIIGLIGMFL